MLYISGIEKLSVVDGSLTTPAIGFAADPDNGLYRIGANNWAEVAGGVNVLEFTATQVKVGSGIVLLIQGAGYVGMAERYIEDLASIRGRDGGDFIVYVNKTDSAATARTMNIQVLDSTGDVWRTVFTASGGAGVTSLTAPVGVHGLSSAQYAHQSDPAADAAALASWAAQINLLLETSGWMNNV